jgi:hypothetical protein
VYRTQLDWGWAGCVGNSPVPAADRTPVVRRVTDGYDKRSLLTSFQLPEEGFYTVEPSRTMHLRNSKETVNWKGFGRRRTSTHRNTITTFACTD